MKRAVLKPEMIAPSVEPLTRTAASGEPLRRSVTIEAEIAEALGASREQLRVRAAANPEAEDFMSSECIVHMIRHDLRAGSRRLADDLMPLLLARCEASLRGSIRGFAPEAAREVREEILGRLAISLVEPGDEADFLEVRFALALKRLRIDACRRQRRRERMTDKFAFDVPEEAASEIEPQIPQAARQEDRLLIRQALAALTRQEREVLVLHKLAGMPLRSRAPSSADLVSVLGRSERTLRNRLRRAEGKLRAFRESTS